LREKQTKEFALSSVGIDLLSAHRGGQHAADGAGDRRR
jgi:hypothetical protein